MHRESCVKSSSRRLRGLLLGFVTGMIFGVSGAASAGAYLFVYDLSPVPTSALMPPLVRRFLKTAVGFLVFGIGLGVYMLARRELWGIWPTPWWTSAHTHAILVGFVMMMIMGVALWMFPRPARDDQHFDPRLAEAAYWFLSLGTAARVAGELLRPTSAGLGVRWTVVAGGCAPGAGAGALLLDDVD